MQELFQPSFTTLTTAPLALDFATARLCIAQVASLVATKPPALSSTQYSALQQCFVAGYSKFAANTDDYTALDLVQLRQQCLKAFSVYTKEVLVQMLAELKLDSAYTELHCVLTDGSKLYKAGFDEDNAQLVAFGSQGIAVSVSSALSMTNAGVLYYA